MTRNQAFWLMMLVAVSAIGYQSFQAPSAFWNADFFETPPQMKVGLSDFLHFRDMQFVIGIKDGKLEVSDGQPSATAPAEDTDSSASDTDAPADSPAPPVAEAVPEPPKAPVPPKAKAAPVPTPSPVPSPEAANKPAQQALDDYARQVRKTIALNRLDDLQQCYLYFLDRTNSAAEGHMQFTLSVSGAGRISDATVAIDDLHMGEISIGRGSSISLGACVSQKIVGLTMQDSPPSRGAMTMPYDLNFQLPDGWRRGAQ